jgi:hypothetical protein
MMVEAVYSGVRGAMKLTGAMLGSAGRGARDIIGSRLSVIQT